MGISKKRRFSPSQLERTETPYVRRMQFLRFLQKLNAGCLRFRENFFWPKRTLNLTDMRFS